MQADTYLLVQGDMEISLRAHADNREHDYRVRGSTPWRWICAVKRRRIVSEIRGVRAEEPTSYLKFTAVVGDHPSTVSCLDCKFSHRVGPRMCFTSEPLRESATNPAGDDASVYESDIGFPLARFSDSPHTSFLAASDFHVLRSVSRLQAFPTVELDAP